MIFNKQKKIMNGWQLKIMINKIIQLINKIYLNAYVYIKKYLIINLVVHVMIKI